MASFRLIFLLPVLTVMTSSLHGQTVPPLLEAIRNNDSLLVKKLIGESADLAITDRDGDGVLMYSALYADSSIMKQLLEAGAAPNQQNQLGETALMWAVPDLAKSRLLLAFKADPNTSSNDGNTALHIACVGNNQTGIIRLLIDHGADVTLKNKKDATALIRLAGYGDTASASLLFANGAVINARKKDSVDALFTAVKCVNEPMVKWLLDHGADTDLQDQYKATAFYYAVIFNNLPIVKMLLDKTTELNRPDLDGATPLMWAVYNEHDNTAIIQLLLDKGADPKYKTKDGVSVLDWALKKGETKTVALLRKYQAK